MVRATRASLPGMGLARKTTVSPRFNRTSRKTLSKACCRRWTLLVKVVTKTRPGASANRCWNRSPTTRSEGVMPGRSTLVLSRSRASTPSCPSSASRATSVGLPSVGVWSNLQSPLTTTVPPPGVRTTTLQLSGTLWATRTHSTSKGPSRTRCRGRTPWKVPSRTLWRTRPKVSGVPYTGTPNSRRR